MSTRRGLTTRAMSRASSRASTGPSPAIDEDDIPDTTPARRSSRKPSSNVAANLPAVASKASTAYGLNTTAQPSSLRIPEAGQDAEDALENLLGNHSLPAVREEDSSSSDAGHASTTRRRQGSRAGRRSAVSKTLPDASFNNESGIFGGAGLDSSSISLDLPARRSYVSQQPQQPIQNRSTHLERERAKRRADLAAVAQTPVIERPIIEEDLEEEPAPTLWYQLYDKTTEGMLWFVVKLIQLMQSIWAFVKTPLGLFLAGLTLSVIVVGSGYALTSTSPSSFRWYGISDAKHNIGQFIPDFIAHPTQSFESDEIVELSRRIRSTEYDVASLNRASHSYSTDEIADITRRLKQAEHDITRLQKRADVDASTIAHLKHLLSTAAPSSLADVQRFNHFSPMAGTIINMERTSPNYEYPQWNRGGIFAETALWFFAPPARWPNDPVVALQKWDEYGECWCSPSKTPDGAGPSLGVIMERHIFPDQIVIEQPHKRATIEIESAPKEMEMLAFIEDANTYHEVKRVSDEIFQVEGSDDETVPLGYVRIAAWEYDIHSDENFQSFVPQVDLTKFAGGTNRIVVRSKTNWGSDHTCLYRVRVSGDFIKTD